MWPGTRSALSWRQRRRPLLRPRVRSATLLAGWATTDARQRVTFDLWRRLIAIDKTLFMRYAVADGFTADGIAMLEPVLEAMVPMSAAAVADGSDAQLDLDIRVDIAGLLGSITAPTLVISGAEDRWVPASHGQALAAAIAGARYEELPAGHLVIQERAAEVAALLSAPRSVRMTTGRADQHDELDEEAAARWAGFGRWDRTYYPSLIGLVIEEVRQDYCRMRLPFRPELEQPAGVVHGGAIASLLDTVVVPAIGSAYGPEVGYATIDFHVQYQGALRQEDAVAEGWVTRRGRSIVFCDAVAVGASSGKVIAKASLTYHVSHPR